MSTDISSGASVPEQRTCKTEEEEAAERLWKCLVCGEIFDSSLGICPVCGVGKEFL